MTETRVTSSICSTATSTMKNHDEDLDHRSISLIGIGGFYLALTQKRDTDDEKPQDEFNKQTCYRRKEPHGVVDAGRTPTGFVATLAASGRSDWHFISNIGMPWCEPPARMVRLHLTQSLPIMLQFLYRNHVTPYHPSPSTFRRRLVAKKKYWNVSRRRERTNLLALSSRLRGSIGCLYSRET